MRQVARKSKSGTESGTRDRTRARQTDITRARQFVPVPLVENHCCRSLPVRALGAHRLSLKVEKFVCLKRYVIQYSLHSTCSVATIALNANT